MAVRRHHLRWVPCAAVVAAAVLSAAHAAESPSGPIGQSLGGEACRWGDAPAERAPGLPRTQTIMCGNEEAPAAVVAVVPLAAPLPDAPKARDAAILAAAKSAPSGLGSTAGLSCGAGQSLARNGDDRLFICVLQSTGWPRVVLVETAGNSVYEADGLPALLPVLQQALAATSGRALSADETEAAIRLVDARFPAALARAGGGDVTSYKALVELGRIDGAARNFAAAEAAYRRALDIETRLFGENGVPVGETLMELALQVSNQERFDEAAGLFRRAEPILNAAPDVAARARLASYRALDAANQRHFVDALKYAHVATQMRRAELAQSTTSDGSEATPAAGGRGELAHSLRIEAEMALRLGDIPTALAAATEVLHIITEDPSLPLWWRPEAVALMAEVDARRERVVQAERQFRDAIAMEKTLFGDTAPTAMGELRLGRFYTGQQIYGAAVDAYLPALDILARDEVARDGITPDQIVPFLTAASAVAARDASKRGELDAAMFRASQLVGSDVAGRTVAHAASRLAADNPALVERLRTLQDAQRQRDALRIQLAAETAKADDRRDPARERRLDAALHETATRVDQLTQALRAAFPDYANFADPGPAPLAELQHMLAPGEAYLSFVIGSNRSYALLVTQDGLSAQKLDLTDAALAADVTELRTAFVPHLGKVGEFDLAQSYELYQHLLGPLVERLRGIEHLIVAPSEALASLPLALLVTAKPGDSAHRSYVDAAWLVRRMAVSEVPSARVFLSLRNAGQHHVPAPRPLLAVADAAFTGASAESDRAGGSALDALARRCRENGPMPADLLRALPPLHETADEVRAVARDLGGAGNDTILLGKDATESNLRRQALDQYRVIYFATHGLLPGELRCQSEPGLVLSPPPSPARANDEDGLLEASEIAGLKLNADLVVLSACNTAASGGQFGGEALAGLAASFFNAGARTLLASHWQVPSGSTLKLMNGVFQEVARGRNLAQALRQAQLALIADAGTAHPFQWAAFTIIGDGAVAAQTAEVPPANAPPARGRT